MQFGNARVERNGFWQERREELWRLQSDRKAAEKDKANTSVERRRILVKGAG